MSRPIVIVNPFSSGSELAKTFAAKGIPAVAVLQNVKSVLGFGSELQQSEYIEIINYDETTIERLKQLDPIGILPGTDESVNLTDQLVAAITPHRSNDMSKTLHRQHKALMQEALAKANLPHIRTINTNSPDEVISWLKENDLENSPLIVKPPLSAGSDKVFHIPSGGNWQKAFHEVLTVPSKLTNELSKTVVIQEQAIGTEYAIGTVSANGQHYLSHIIKYNKATKGDRLTIYDFVEFIPYDETAHKDLIDYTFKVLDALGIKWGAAHNEIMLTAKGPRLIETGARMLGGPTVGFSREATGLSQADRLVEVYLTGDVVSKEFKFKKLVIPVMIRAPKKGVVTNVEVFEEIDNLETLFRKYLWCKNGDSVDKTEDYLTNLGIVALTGERQKIMKDYEKIRMMESRLIIKSLP